MEGVKTRCKMQIVSVKEIAYNRNLKEYELCVISSKDVPEDEAFTKYTPSGTIKVSIDNPSVHAILNNGQYCFVDIIPIKEG